MAHPENDMSKRDKTYTPEFRAEAVKRVLEQGLRQEEAANRLGIPKGTLAGWMAAAVVENTRSPRRPLSG